MDRVECVVVGAGVVGLATARAFALEGREVLVVERADTVGTETSSRSNEVMHAGIFYRRGGPQAVLSVRGQRQLYTYCADHGVPHRRIGKLVLAVSDGATDWLAGMRDNGRHNGVEGLELIGPGAVGDLEPGVRCQGALYSPNSGIIDSHALMVAYRGDLEAAGGMLALRTEMIGAWREGAGFVVETRDREGAVTRIGCSWLINAAGPWAGGVARGIRDLPPALVPKVHYVQGAFFKLSGRSPFRHLLVPDPGVWGRGGILTLDLGGEARFGPDATFVETIGYDFDPARVEGVYRAVRSYWPDLPDGALHPDYAGIQPKLNGPGKPQADWMFQGPAHHGVPALINLFGFESPGITASLAIAEVVAGMLRGAAPPFDAVAPLG